MRNRSIRTLLVAVLALAALFAVGGTGLGTGILEQWGQGQPGPGQTAPVQTGPAQAEQGRPAQGQTGKSTTPASRPAANPSGLPEIRESELPAEGRKVLALIRAGGPFAYSQDDQAFGNFERVLPQRTRGYYREYTVPTPGEPDRGARRIVAGEGGEKYYTADHYETFTYIAEGS
ncbi:guanyl-specific ribonuclease [Arthrobacter sp. C152]